MWETWHTLFIVDAKIKKLPCQLFLESSQPFAQKNYL